MPSLDREEIRERARKCKSASELLHTLKDALRQYGLIRFRLYELVVEQQTTTTKSRKSVKETESIIGVASAGHEDDPPWTDSDGRTFQPTDLFQAGHWMSTRSRIKKSTGAKSKWNYATDTHSFLCFNTNKRKPLLYWHKSGVTNKDAPTPIESSEVHEPNTVVVGKDYAADFLAPVKTRHWVDFPMVFCGEYIGKITADISTPCQGTTALNLLLFQAQECIDELTPAFDALSNRSSKSRISEITEHVRNCSTAKELFSYCVNELPRQIFESDHASVFTSISDFQDRKKLILRDSSFPDLLRNSELDQAYYPISQSQSKGLTPRVFVEGRTLRLQCLKSTKTRELQIRNWLHRSNRRESDHDPIALEWSPSPSRIVDSFAFSSFLAAPLLDTHGNVIGVYRLTEKLNPASSFYSAREEKILEEICSEILGPRIATLMKLEMERLVFSNLSKVNTLSIRSATEQNFNLDESIRDALLTFIPGSEDAPKKYISNKVNNSEKMIYRASIGGLLDCDEEKLKDPIPLSQHSTTSVAINERRTILVTETDEFPGLKELIPSARSVLIAPIALDGAPAFGALTVVSTKYDLNPSTHGRLLDVIARQMAEISTRNEALFSLSTVSGASHDVRAPLQSIKDIIRGTEIPFPAVQEAENLVDFTDEVVSTYHASDSQMRKSVAKSRQQHPLPIFRLVESLIHPLKRSLDSEEHKMLRPFEISETLVASVHGSSFKILLFNLLKNACQAEASSVPGGHEGAVAFTCSLKKRSKGLEICTYNKYAKLPDQVMSRMLGFFSDSLNSGEAEGRGMGLNIIHRITKWYDRDDMSAIVVPNIPRNGPYRGWTQIKVFLPVPSSNLE